MYHLRAGLKFILLIFVLVLALVATTGVTVPPLADLTGHWAHTVGAALARRGLIRGLPDGSFRPETAVTRAEGARLIGVAAGIAPRLVAAGFSGSRFSDMPGHWARADVEAAAETGLVRGYPDGTFRPEQPVTRMEMIVLAVRAAGLGRGAQQLGSLPVPYRDLASVPAWAVLDMAAAINAGLVGDLFGQELRPDAPATRAEAAALAARVAFRRGALYHATGTIVSWEPAARRLTLRTASGQTETFDLPATAATFRQGVPGTDFQPLDQVWITLDELGRVLQAEARFEAYLGQLARLEGESLRFVTQNGLIPMRVTVTDATQVFVNGRPSTVQAVHEAGWVYVVMNAETGAARVVDAVKYSDSGTIRTVDSERLVITTAAGPVRTFALTGETVIYAGGKTIDPEGLQPGMRVLVAAQGGRVTYLQTVPG